VIDAYEADYKNLRSHSDKYTTQKKLRSVTKQGHTKPAPEQGFSNATEGSRWIITQVLKDDPRPLYILVWGSMTDVAQALHDEPLIAKKICIHSVGGWNTDQDPHARNYVMQNHNSVWWIENNHTLRGMYMGGKQDKDLGNVSFVEQHVKGHGALGDLFWAKKKDIKMGDTPTVTYLLRGEPDKPETDHWGGRFIKTDAGPNYWTDIADRQYWEPYSPGAKTTNIWREDYLRDWQKRMERCKETNADTE
jgi:Cellulose-binding Sde182, nucleoside hydrolase-like domain